MTAKTIDDLPENARDLRGIFSGVTETGVHFEIRNMKISRRMRSNELVRATLNTQVRGKYMGSMHVEEQKLYLFVQNRHRIEIEHTPSNMYRYGRRIDKSLKNLVVQLMTDMGIDLTPSSTPRF
jgi:hypothetical protein